MSEGGVIVNYCQGALPIETVIELAKEDFEKVFLFLFILFSLSLVTFSNLFYVQKIIICKTAAVFTFLKTKFYKLLKYWIKILVELQMNWRRKPYVTIGKQLAKTMTELMPITPLCTAIQ